MSRGRQPTGEDMQAGSSEPTPVRQDPHWPAFLQSLEEKGFFRGEIDGSQLHRTLMSDAEAFFADMMHGRKEEAVGGSPLAPAAEIRRILGSMPREGEECRVTEDALEPPDGQCLSRGCVLSHTNNSSTPCFPEGYLCSPPCLWLVLHCSPSCPTQHR